MSINYLVIPENISVDKSVVEKTELFITKFPTDEVSHGIPLLLRQDAKSAASYIVCHLAGDVLSENADINAVLDAEDEEYKLNRDLSEDKYAYKLMVEDAIHGRTFEDLVIEFDETYHSTKPLKIYGGQHRISAIISALSNGISVQHGARIYFNLTRDQKVEIATVNNTSIAVPSDLLDRMQEDQLGNELREWCQRVGLLEPNQNFADRGSGDIPTVRVARTLVTNYYLGKNAVDNPNKFYQPVLCTSGPGIDRQYEAIRSYANWGDSDFIEMGKEFATLHRLQMTQIAARKKGRSAAFARKALSLAVVASWALAAGLFQRDREMLQKHYALGKGISKSDDPLNADSLGKARLKGVDKDTYRGLGTRNDSSELGRMFQLFLLQAEQGTGINLELANTAIKYYEGRKLTQDADNEVSKVS